MKSLLLSLFVSMTLSLFGQDYTPLNTPKRFQNSNVVSDNNYYFYPIDTLTNADTVTYVQYLKMGNSTTTLTNGTICSVWGDPNQVVAADTTWLGRYVNYNSVSNELRVENKSGEILNFDFNLALGDSAIFFQSTSEEYYLKYDQLNEETVYGVVDSVKTFLIFKYDPTGGVLASTLNNFEVKLGKSLGLLSLIECNDFPTSEVGVELMGQLFPAIGTYNMTYDELYPWAPGDSLLVKGVAAPVVAYKLITVLDRIETADSVWIHLNFEGDLTAFNIEYPNVIAYKKGENFSITPDISMVNGYMHYNDSGSMCGERKRHHTEFTTKYYCDTFHCFPDYDATGSQFFTGTYLSGLGQTSRVSEVWGPFSSSATATLVYSNVGGVICGTPAALNVKERELEVRISPNPAQNEIMIQTSFEMERVEVLNAAGGIELIVNPGGFDQYIDTSELSRGIYFVHIKSSDGRMLNSKFVQQ